MARRTWTIRSAEDLGRAVADIRKCQHLTQDDLADRIGISRNYLAKLELGRSTPVLDHFLRIFRRLGAGLTVTFEDADGPR